MRKKQAGQALILVLIVLAIGALLVVPSLRLTSTALMGTPTVERHTKGLYAADGATEYILWKLLNDVTWRNDRTEDVPYYFAFNVCGVPVSASVVMRATLGQGGVTLATDDVIKPTKTVEVEGHPEWSNDDGSVNVPNGYSGPYTYIIKMEQLSNDNSKGVDSVYDVLPKGLDYYASYGSWLRMDGGDWVSLPVHIDTIGGQNRLRWPDSGFFDEEIRHFDVREVKEIKFQVTGSLANDTVNYNWVLLNVEDIDTLSGPIAPIKLGLATKLRGGLITVTKASDPELIQPGEQTDIEYTISITNLEIAEDQIYSITDYLPPDFEYLGPVSGITSENPQITFDTDLDRYKLLWTTDEFPNDNAISIASSATVTLTFWARATKDVSGTYYNEVVVVNKVPLSGNIYTPPDMDVTEEDFLSNYSWNTGEVMVPAYDTSSDAEGITINSNMALILGGITITSWGVD